MFNITTPYKYLSPPHQAALLEAIKNTPWILDDASEMLKNDRDFFLAAVQQDGLALVFASDALRADREVVFAAARNFVSDKLRADYLQTQSAYRLFLLGMFVRNFPSDLKREVHGYLGVRLLPLRDQSTA